MPKEQTQRKKITDIFESIDEVLENAVTKEEMEAIVRQFADSFANLKSQINGKMAENKASIGTSFDKLRLSFNGIKREVLKTMEEADAQTKKDLGKDITQLSEQVKSIRELIPDKEKLRELYEELEEMESQLEEMASLCSAENVRNALESLNGDDRTNASALIIETEKDKFRSLDVVIRELLEDLKRIERRFSYGGGASNGAGGGSVGPITPRHQAFAVTSATTEVTLSSGVAAQGTAIWVRYQGQMLDYGVDYTVSGNKVTFVDYTFVDGTEVSVTYWS